MVGQNYYGLRGVKLNIAIAIVAGTDFALFGKTLCARGDLDHQLHVSRCTEHHADFVLCSLLGYDQVCKSGAIRSPSMSRY